MTTTDSKINQLFNNLDAWRHLPAYQLERRADIFFSLYLAEVLQKKFNLSDAPVLIPEFPVRYGLVPKENGKAGENQSFKIDYLAVTKDGKHVFFVELKTDMASRKPAQDEIMERAADIEGYLLFSDIKNIHKASNAKQKYLSLYNYMHEHLHTEENTLTETADGTIQKIISEEKFKQFFASSNKPTIVYLQPNKSDKDVETDRKKYIDFAYFADVVKKHTDCRLSELFENSLRKWAAVKAGSKQ